MKIEIPLDLDEHRMTLSIPLGRPAQQARYPSVPYWRGQHKTLPCLNGGVSTKPFHALLKGSPQNPTLMP